MSMYRCCICGSPNVVKSDSNDGFSYRKALVGTAVFGTVGAVAGINGKKTATYVCADCGRAMPQPMDTITKDKIDLVMTNPDLLAGKIYPTIFEDYTYLRKEKEAKDALAVEKVSAYSQDYANPLDISEKEFRQAAKAFCAAFDQLQACQTSLAVHSDFAQARVHITDMDAIAEGLRSVRTLMYGIPAYPSLVMMDTDYTHSGLGRGYLCAAAILHVLMENGGKMTLDAFYSCVMCNSVYQQAFRTLMGSDYQNAVSFRQDVIVRRSAATFNADDKKQVWFFALKKPYVTAWMCLKNAPSKQSLGRKLDSVWEFPFKLINMSLYVPNAVSETEQFEEDMPELAREMAAQEKNIAELKKNISAACSTKPGAQEIDAQNKIDQLRRENTQMDIDISKLRKKIFGKKKALAEIQSLNDKMTENREKIASVQASLDAVKKMREEEAKKKRDELELKMKDTYQALEEMQKQKNEYIAQLPKWQCIAGPDMES